MMRLWIFLCFLEVSRGERPPVHRGFQPLEVHGAQRHRSSLLESWGRKYRRHRIRRDVAIEGSRWSKKKAAIPPLKDAERPQSLQQDSGDDEVKMDAVEEADKAEQKNQDGEVAVAEENEAGATKDEKDEAEEPESPAQGKTQKAKDAAAAGAGEKKQPKEEAGEKDAPKEDQEDAKQENADIGAPDARLEQDAADAPGLDIPKAGSQKWKSCETHNAHKCVDMKHCCCNVGTTYHHKQQMCIQNKEGDRDPEVVSRQIPHSRQKASFGTCRFERGMHPCGTGCCCNGELEYDVDTKKCEDSPAITGPTASETSMSDPAPPKEDPIPGSQTWIQTGATCESKEAYGCGGGKAHCCCRFGCEFIENWDSCGRCKNEVPKVLQNMIPASQLWESRVKKGICNARSSHPCGAGCCCNAGFTWSKEQRRCLSPVSTVQESQESSAPAPAPATGEKGSDGGSQRAGVAMFALLLPLLWTRL